MDFQNINRFVKKYKYYIITFIIALIVFLVIFYRLPKPVNSVNITSETKIANSETKNEQPNQICKCNLSDPSQIPVNLPCSNNCLKSCNCPLSGEGFIFSFQTSYLVTSLNINSPKSGDLSTMPSGIALLGSNDSGNTWNILFSSNSINWTLGSNVFHLQNITTPYSVFAVVITSLSQSNYGLIGQIKLISDNHPITLSSTSYDKIKSGNYMSYPGFQFNKIATNNFSISYTNMISTPIGSISTDNIKNLVFSDLTPENFGVLQTNTTYANGKPTQQCPVFQINWW